MDFIIDAILELLLGLGLEGGMEASDN